MSDHDEASGSLTGDEIVISGISGIFPNSDSVKEFANNLYNKVNMVNDYKFNNAKHLEMPQHVGKVTGLNSFDAQFFRVTSWQALTLDPVSRKLMEHAFSAMFDAGMNPTSGNGTRLGVYMSSSSDSAYIHLFDVLNRNKFVISGCSKTMTANRISYWIDGKAPSYAVDTASAGSMTCLELAYRSIKSGECESALVGGANMISHPKLFLNLKRAGHLCLDGKTKCFDKNGDGYVRSEAVNFVYLQKAKNAKRIYAEVVYAKAKYFASPDDLFLPIRDSRDIQHFLEEFYSECNVSSNKIEYVEANGAGIAEADSNELEAIGQVFGQKHVKVGSVKSNMGNSEAASGVCALTKVCLAYQRGELPANLHYSEPLDHIAALRDGRIQVLTDSTPFKRGYTAINNFSFTGCNYHILLKGHYKAKKMNLYTSPIPYIILFSGRHAEGVEKVLSTLKNSPVDPEQIALLHNIFEHNIPGHTGRGYTILDKNKLNETVNLAQGFEYYTGETRPVWFMYSGMGSQWASMGAQLMRIPIFAAAIERCRKILQPRGVDIVKIITEPEEDIFDNILNSFVGIAAVQIGLTDILTALRIVPDKIIGHSVGEVGCAYADNCLTAEETILASYYRGLASVQTKFIHGSMAAVGLGYKEVLPLCPPEIAVACHNSSKSSTISGPTDIMKKFVADLTSGGIFAKEVPTSNIAYHSKYVSNAGPTLLSHMKTVIKEPKIRSEKWVCTSVPQEQWDTAQYASAEYFTNNLLNPVYFEETAKMIPSDAIVIEIAPHGLLQAIVKRSHKECTHVPLTRRGDTDSVTFLLKALGKLYQVGLNFKVHLLYPKVEFPVSTETPTLSELVEWDHSEQWHEYQVSTPIKETMAAREIVISFHDNDYKYLDGHVIDGVNVLPESAFLVLVWETLALYNGVNYQELSVVFDNVKFNETVIIKQDQQLMLNIAIQKGSQRFEVTHQGSEISSGFIKGVIDTSFKEKLHAYEDEDIKLKANEVYNILSLKGYSYKNEFQSISSVNIDRNNAQIKWTGEWVTFLDSLIQFNVLASDHDAVSSPMCITNLSIDVKRHYKENKTVIDDVALYNAELCNKMYNVTKCGGVKIQAIIFTNKPKKEVELNIQKRTFIPYFPTELLNLNTSLEIQLQIVAENANEDEIIITEMYTAKDAVIYNFLIDAADKVANYKFIINSVRVQDNDAIKNDDLQKCNLIVVHNHLDDKNLHKMDINNTNNSLIMCVEHNNVSYISKSFKMLNIITCMMTAKYKLILLKKPCPSNVALIKLEPDRSWMPLVESEINRNKRIVLVSEKENYSTIEGFIKALNKQNIRNISALVIEDINAPVFNINNYFYMEQLSKNIKTNVLKKGRWGNYFCLSTDASPDIENENVALINTGSGKFDDLEWIDVPIASRPASIQVCYSGLSLKDCQKVMEQEIEGDRLLGMDFSGYNNNNERVMGVVAGGALGSSVEADPDLLWPVPEHWTLEDAATVPLPYILAYYCLTMKGQLNKHQSVFVTGGAGALGQAVISLCLAFGCTVYTSVSNIDKKKFLMKIFPKLNENNISFSRHQDFSDTLKHNSKNKRCDFVINCATGKLREAAMKCVGFYGFFLDISDHDSRKNHDFGLFYLEEDRVYKRVNISNIFMPQNIKDRKKLQTMLSEGISRGMVRPLSRVTYLPEDVPRAFKLLSSSGHRGRVLIRMKDLTRLTHITVKQRLNLSPTASYIVVCDEYVLGSELVDHLIKRGANKIILHVTTDLGRCYLQMKCFMWRKCDVTVELSSENLEEVKGCKNLIANASALGPVQGIFVIKYNEWKYQAHADQDEFEKYCKGTSTVLANLDNVSRILCDFLSYFVIVSNFSQDFVPVIESAERICEKRNEIGLPALLLRIDFSNQVNSDFNGVVPPLSQILTRIFNALEMSLKQNSTDIVINISKQLDNPDYLKLLANSLVIENIEDIDEKAVLDDLKLNYEKLREVKDAIEKSHQINLTNEKLNKMTIASLRVIDNQRFKNTKFNIGLGAFYHCVADDLYLATEPIITMKTRISTSNEREDDLDPNITYLMMIPGFDGYNQIFTSISEQLQIRSVTIQLDPDSQDDSIEKIAMSVFKHIKTNFELHSKFYFLGYSFGVNIALELAALMEKEGRVGVVYCLDSSPDALRIHLEAYMGCLDDNDLQNTILSHIFWLSTGKEAQELKEDLKKVKTWPQKIDTFIFALKQFVTYSHQYLRSLADAAYRRIKLARKYDPCLKLDSELVLIKGVPHPKAEGLTNDYNLSKYTNQPVRVSEIDSDHASAPQDCRVPFIINSLLDPQIVEEFKRLCTFYFKSK